MSGMTDTSGEQRDGRERLGWRTGALVGGVALAVLVGMVALAWGSEQPAPPQPTPTPVAKTELEFGVWGNDAEVAAYEGVVDDYNATSKDTTVTLRTWSSAEDMMGELAAGAELPDLYLVAHADLAETIAEGRNEPLVELVIKREIPIGDDFSRQAVDAFSVDDDLQCLPYAISPMVIYYNPALVDFEAMDAEGLPTPSEELDDWNFSEFRAAAEFASRPGPKTKGVHIEPTMAGIAPFVYSGGGQMFNDPTEPTSLALSDDGSTDALRQTLELLRDPQVTLSESQLEKRSALEWFQRGKLGMIAGHRGLTPELRATEGLEFDVMPMPSLGTQQTVGELSGVCLAPGKPAKVEASANFLTYLVSDEAVGRLAETGYVQPTKLTVALSDVFLQPTRLPVHAATFNDTVRDIVPTPLIVQGRELADLVNPDIEALLTTPVLGPDELQASLAAIDETSRTLLDPDYEPSEEPSDGESTG